MNQSLQSAFDAVKNLAADFKANEQAFLNPTYSEAQVRQDFIDKFFTALGWDVTHAIQKNPYEQEVKIENRVSVQGSQRRADYAFFLAPNFQDVKFLVEAKKPSRHLKNKDDYFQTIRYSWNRNAPVAVLTDFEEFHILDCRFKPNIAYALDFGITSFHYSDYLNEEKFTEIYYLFSREAVANGSLEKFAESLPKPKKKGVQNGLFKGGFQKVDEAFLESLDGYRETLAKAFKAKNPHLDGESLTEAVQRTLDRLVFIRFLEDKQIEDAQVKHLGDKGDSWKAFRALCRALEPKYNGLVFKAHPILDDAKFAPPDEAAFGGICKELSDTTSPYDFAEIPIAILGSIYERFLGKVVSVSEKRAKVIEKPEVRKAGGVYYTPEYIVRYIVAETVGKMIDGKTPDEISNMAFADIACGSGSFLIEVYGQLLDYHARYYLQHPDKIKKGDTDVRNGVTLLSLKKRREILTNNIYGCDIDYQATEVTQLSLYLKLLEDATTGDAHQFGLLKEKILPDLKHNIVCGNSLIGTDILDGSLFEPDEERKLNPMNFEDAFPTVMKRGGFDAIVGNPPWSSKMPNSYSDYIASRYKMDAKNLNLFAAFILAGLSLLRKSGCLGILIPKVFIKNSSYSEIRKSILSDFHLSQLIDFGKFPFVASDAVCPIVMSEKSTSISSTTIKQVETGVLKSVKELKTRIFQQNPVFAFSFDIDDDKQTVLQKIQDKTVKLSDVAVIKRGIEVGQKSTLTKCQNCGSFNEAGEKYYNTTKKKKVCKFCGVSVKIDAEKISISNQTETAFYKTPCVSGKEVDRYEKKSNYLIPELLKGIDYKLEIFSGDRIFLRRISDKPLGFFVPAFETLLAFNTVYSIHKIKNYHPLYILSVLNSKLIRFYYENTYNLGMNLTTQITIEYLSQFPIRALDLSQPLEKAMHDRIVKLVEQMLSAKEKRAGAVSEQEQTRLSRTVAGLDRQIDEAVYELYGLTDEEIKLVEG